jgi:glycosyltransferase involved in cell wall biosynthesis
MTQTATPGGNADLRLRIGFPYAGDRFGGSNVSSLLLARALLDRGHLPQVLTHGDGRAADEARVRGLPVKVLPPLSSKAGYSRSDRARLEQIYAIHAALVAIRVNRLDIVHVNDLSMLRIWALPTVIARRAFVTHWRTALAPSRSVALALRGAAAIVAISGRSRSVLPIWARQKAFVEYNPIETYVPAERRTELKAAIRAQLGLPQNAVLLGVFGTLIRRKRAHVLAEILSSVSATPDGRPVFGIICGERAEPLDELLFEKIAAFDLGSRIRMLGFVRPVENWMAACDLVLAPAVDEAFGRTPLEAFASGTLALVSSDCGAAELIREDRETLVLPPDPIEAWVQSVAALLADRRRMAAIADRASAAVAGLSAEAHAGRIEAIYHHLLAKQRTRLSMTTGQEHWHQQR